jgi:prepilin-type N-terminal cleavage/methylation domain-containing protein
MWEVGKMESKRIKGFTLIELLIVVAIIAILAAIAVPNFLEAQTRAKTARVKADQRTIATAIESYAIDYSVAPIGQMEQGSMAPPNTTNSPWDIKAKVYSRMTTPIAYITSVPQDPFYMARVIPASPRTGVASYVETDTEKAYDYFEYNYTFGWHMAAPVGLLPAGFMANNYGKHWFPYQPANPSLPGYVPPRGFYGPFQKGIMWSLSSSGPTRKLPNISTFNWGINRILAIPDENAAIYVGGFYDPTNGTVSPGMIARSTRGIEPS